MRDRIDFDVAVVKASSGFVWFVAIDVRLH